MSITKQTLPRFFRQGLCAGLILLGGTVSSCTDPFTPEVTSSPPSFLVVDGFLNSQGVTTVRLSRTFAVAAKTAPPAETRATVYIEDEAGTKLLLSETTGGVYRSAALALSPTRQYRLHLRTATGQEYASAYVPVKTTPPVDAVNWRPTSDGLRISVDAHDATGATQYYRWETDETWEIRSPYSPTVEYVNRAMRDLLVPFPRPCYGNTHSTAVQLYKTTSLGQDVVSDFQVRQLPRPTPLLFSRYSILVQQHALTKEEYAYWELLRKNTESIGSLFDAQPAQLTGNVQCLSNPAEPVLGFVGAHSLTEKRIFIARNQLPPDWPLADGYESCVPPDTVYLFKKPSGKPAPAERLESNFNPSSGVLPIDALLERGVVIGYTAKGRECIDCRTRGTVVKPSFW